MNLKDKYHYFNEYVAVLKSYNVYEYERIGNDNEEIEKKKKKLHNYYGFKYLSVLVIIFCITKITRMIATTPDFPLWYLLSGTLAGWVYYFFLRKINRYQHQIRQSEKLVMGAKERLRLLFMNHHFRRALIATSYNLQQNEIMHIDDYRYLQDTIINQLSDNLYSKVLQLETHMHVFLDNLGTSTEKYEQDEKNRENLINQLFSEDNAPAKSGVYKPVLKVIRG